MTDKTENRVPARRAARYAPAVEALRDWLRQPHGVPATSIIRDVLDYVATLEHELATRDNEAWQRENRNRQLLHRVADLVRAMADEDGEPGW